MLRYKNSLLERILLEKGPCPARPFTYLTYLAEPLPQVSMSKLSYALRRPVQTWARLMSPSLWCSRHPYSARS